MAEPLKVKADGDPIILVLPDEQVFHVKAEHAESYGWLLHITMPNADIIAGGGDDSGNFFSDSVIYLSDAGMEDE